MKLKTIRLLQKLRQKACLLTFCQSFLQMLVSSVAAGLVAPALWGSVGGLAGGMAACLLLGITCFGLWWALYHRTRVQPEEVLP